MGDSTNVLTPLQQNNAQHEATLAFEIVQHVTRPVMQLSADPSFIRVDGPIYEADKQTVSRRKKNPDGTPAAVNSKFAGPPELLPVTDLIRNRPAVVVVNEVLGSELRRTYPDDTYVGKSFRIIKNMLQGKGYATFEIAEVRLKGAPAPVETATAPIDNGYGTHTKGKK